MKIKEHSEKMELSLKIKIKYTQPKLITTNTRPNLGNDSKDIEMMDAVCFLGLNIYSKVTNSQVKCRRIAIKILEKIFRVYKYKTQNCEGSHFLCDIV